MSSTAVRITSTAVRLSETGCEGTARGLVFIVMRGLVPRIHVFGMAETSRACPGQARARRSGGVFVPAWIPFECSGVGTGQPWIKPGHDGANDRSHGLARLVGRQAKLQCLLQSFSDWLCAVRRTRPASFITASKIKYFRIRACFGAHCWNTPSSHQPFEQAK